MMLRDGSVALKLQKDPQWMQIKMLANLDTPYHFHKQQHYYNLTKKGGIGRHKQGWDA